MAGNYAAVLRRPLLKDLVEYTSQALSLSSATLFFLANLNFLFPDDTQASCLLLTTQTTYLNPSLNTTLLCFGPQTHGGPDVWEPK